MSAMISIILIIGVVSCIPLVWFAVHLLEFRRTKNIWSIVSASIFCLSFILIIAGLITLFIGQQKNEYIFWRFGSIVSVGVFTTGFGALIRFILRLTNRV